MGQHWVAFVNWSTIVDWKSEVRSAAAEGRYPYQYSSNHPRFREIKRGDVLWVVTTPRFGATGQPSSRGRARPPAVMARLRIKKLCCYGENEARREEKGKKPVCRDSSLPDCDDPGVLEQGVHPASSSWSIVAVGEEDPEEPDPLEVTYPALYNCFGVLRRLRFETKRRPTDLCEYLEYVESGHYLTDVTDPGPYGRFGQYMQAPRKLTEDAASAMDELHTRAVQGNRVFFSYKWVDVERFANDRRLSREEWIQVLNRKLDRANYTPWLDHHQITTDEDIGGLLDEVLADAVRQAALFVALLSPSYGTGRTLDEWNDALDRAADERHRDKLMPIVLDCGGDPGRLGLKKEDVHPIPSPPRPRDIVDAIERVVGGALS